MKLKMTMGETASNHIAEYTEKQDDKAVGTGTYNLFYEELILEKCDADIINIHESSIQLFKQNDNFQQALNKYLGKLNEIISTYKTRVIIINNLEALPVRFMGNHDALSPRTYNSLINEYNEKIYELIKKNANVLLLDIKYLQNWFGMEKTLLQI